MVGKVSCRVGSYRKELEQGSLDPRPFLARPEGSGVQTKSRVPALPV